MRRHILKWIVKLDGIFNLAPKRINVDAIMEENMKLMKESKMHRMSFYKYHSKA